MRAVSAARGNAWLTRPSVVWEVSIICPVGASCVCAVVVSPDACVYTCAASTSVCALWRPMHALRSPAAPAPLRLARTPHLLWLFCGDATRRSTADAGRGTKALQHDTGCTLSRQCGAVFTAHTKRQRAPDRTRAASRRERRTHSTTRCQQGQGNATRRYMT